MQFNLEWEVGVMSDGIRKVKYHQELAAGHWYEGHVQSGVSQCWYLEAEAGLVSLVFNHLKLNGGENGAERRRPAGGGCSNAGQMLPLEVLSPAGRAAGLSVAAACWRYQELPKMTRKKLNFEQN